MDLIKNLLFDLDGTIIEPEEGIINSILFALNEMGIEEPNKDKLKAFIGPPLIDSFLTYYDLNLDQANLAVEHYRLFFSKQGIHQNNLYDGIEDSLQYFKKQNYRLFIATSKPTIFAEKILANYQLTGYFDGVIGSNLDNTRKDKAEIIQFVLSKFGLRPNESLMIGDRKYDIEGAKKNHLESVGVTYGHGSIEELKAAGTNYLVANPLALKSLINLGESLN